MSERKRARTTSPSSPLATVDEIQRRLIRPSSASSPPPISTFSSPPEDRRVQIQKLEDYLDLKLLGEVSAKLSHARKSRDLETRSVKKEVNEFEWPVNELNVLVVESEKGAVDLNDDLDRDKEFGDGNVETCTPFRRFEQSALRRFGE